MEDLPELHERYEKNIQGQLSCFDRILLFGTFGNIAYPDAMAWELKQANCKFVDYGKNFANELRLQMRDHVEELAAQEGISIEHVNMAVRKESLIANVLKQRGEHTGIVHIISAMERCSCFKVGKNHKTGFLELQWNSGKCLHYYIYFIDEEFGLGYMRIPTWAPCRLQVYLNGHNWLARQMDKAGISFSQLDNCFVDISDYAKAQEIADSLDPQKLHKCLDRYAKRFCACYARWPAVHWSIAQIEYATDIVFKSTQILPTLYKEPVRGAVNEVEAADVYSFMGKRLTKASADEVSVPQGRSYRGINFFETNDLKFIQALVRGEHTISGFTNRILQRYLPDWTSGKISRMIRRFKAHRLIKGVHHTYKYYLTKRARSLLFAHLQLTNRVIIPALAT